MSPRSKRQRVHGVSYWFREGRGWYGDFRRFGGGREALGIVERDAAPERIQEAVWVRRRAIERGDPRAGRDPLLVAYSERWLASPTTNLRPRSVGIYRSAVATFLRFVGQDTHLDDVGVRTLNDFVRWRRDGGVSNRTIRGDLTALSSLYRFAVEEGVAASNPVRNLPAWPRGERHEAVWLEVGEAARLLRVAGELVQAKARVPWFWEVLVATAFLTGGRRNEVFGLEVEDVDLERGLVQFRSNVWRPLKTDGSARYVPLWPQLRALLEPHMERVGSGLLFPSKRTGGICTRLYASLARTVAAARIEKRVGWHTARHTYAATRMQTLDHDQPVSPYTVARELGHRSLGLVEQTYAHLQRTRHRLAVVEYREADVVELASWRAG